MNRGHKQLHERYHNIFDGEASALLELPHEELFIHQSWRGNSKLYGMALWGLSRMLSQRMRTQITQTDIISSWVLIVSQRFSGRQKVGLALAQTGTHRWYGTALCRLSLHTTLSHQHLTRLSKNNIGSSPSFSPTLPSSLCYAIGHSVLPPQAPQTSI